MVISIMSTIGLNLDALEKTLAYSSSISIRLQEAHNYFPTTCGLWWAETPHALAGVREEEPAVVVCLSGVREGNRQLSSTWRLFPRDRA